jgi:hypothetical protein
MLRQIASASTLSIIAVANFASLSLAASPTMLNNCQTISSPGNYQLSSNLSASGDCFTITASNVSIDLKGHSLMGDLRRSAHGATAAFQYRSCALVVPIVNSVLEDISVTLGGYEKAHRGAQRTCHIGAQELSRWRQAELLFALTLEYAESN